MSNLSQKTIDSMFTGVASKPKEANHGTQITLNDPIQVMHKDFTEFYTNSVVFLGQINVSIVPLHLNFQTDFKSTAINYHSSKEVSKYVSPQFD